MSPEREAELRALAAAGDKRLSDCFAEIDALSAALAGAATTLVSLTAAVTRFGQAIDAVPHTGEHGDVAQRALGRLGADPDALVAVLEEWT